MGYLTIVLEGGPLEGGRVPMTGGTVRYGHILELPYTEELQTFVRSDYATTSTNGGCSVEVTRRERTAIYKCMASVVAEDDIDSTATFVGVLR